MQIDANQFLQNIKKQQQHQADIVSAAISNNDQETARQHALVETIVAVFVEALEGSIVAANSDLSIGEDPVYRIPETEKEKRKHQRTLLKVEKIVYQSGGDGVSVSDLYTKLNGVHGSRIRKAIKDLKASELIFGYEAINVGPGRPKVIYKHVNNVKLSSVARKPLLSDNTVN